MGGPVLLFLTSICAVAVAWMAQSPEALMLVGPAAIASLWILLKALVAPSRPPLARVEPEETSERPRRRVMPRRHKRAPKMIVVDGSNVMHWKDNTAQLDTLLEVLRTLEARGFTPGVVFDANAGYKISGSYRHDYAFGKMLGLPKDRVMVVQSGKPADPVILAAARENAARVVSNDRFRDWAKDFPEVADPAHFLRGGYQDGVLWLQPERVTA
jgi:rRNA-processing protein FCF1